MSRIENWPKALNEYIEAHRGLPFAWGSNDCVTFAAGWVRRCIGVDPLEGLSWKTEGEAKRILVKQPLKARIDLLFDRRPSPLFAQRGDILLALNEQGEEYVALCDGTAAVAPYRTGLTFLPVNAAMIAWEIR